MNEKQNNEVEKIIGDDDSIETKEKKYIPIIKPRKYGTTNKEFAKSNSKFKDQCVKYNVPISTRQASKWRNKRGAAFKGINL